MDGAAWARAKSLLAEAADLPAADRERFVSERCPDPSLRRELLDLLDSPAPLSSILTAGVLAPGETIGSYLIEQPLGRGGMGEVFRARDTVLNRAVAIKVLPAALAVRADRVARFRREAQLLAALNHPNIAQIHGLIESSGVTGLVMELVEGPTLADRIARAPIPVDRAIDIARQIADALAAAHEKGIVHRDLKPANIKVRDDGVVKVLDFGLAKAIGLASSNTDDPTSHATGADETQSGVVLGTIAYMAPEQALGKPVDKRADIWAFGCVLIEMLTRHQAFSGAATSSDQTRMSRSSVESMALPSATPESIRRLLRRCLERDPDRRLRDIADARLELEDAADGVAAPPASARTARSVPIGVAIALVAAAAIAAGVVAWRWRGARATPSSPSGSFTIALPADAAVAGLDTPAVAISPDGTRIVYVGGAARRLYVRRIDDPAVTPMAGTEGASSPFFAPDGRSIGFFAGGRIQRVSLDGGVPSVICGCSAGNPRGAVWGADGTIVFAPFPASSLMKVNVDEGVDRPVTVLDLKRGEGGHRWPDFVPDGSAVVFVTGTATARTWDDGDIIVQSLTTGERRILAQGTFPRFTASGHLAYVRAGVLLAAPFDVKRLAISGPAIRITDGVMQSTFGAAQFAVSNTGSLVHLAGSVGQRQLTWVTRSGDLEPLPTAARTYWAARLSPDGQRLATAVENPGYDIWTYDFSSGGASLDRLTSGGTHAWPVWSADGTHITFNSTADTGVLNLFWKRADGSGSEERLTRADRLQIPDSWSPDGHYLAFTDSDRGGRRFVAILDRSAGTTTPFHQTEFDEGGPMFSPDGRWLAYSSNESGQPEVYVRPFPGPGEKRRVSSDGGSCPVWARNGRELFYRSGRQLLAVDVAPGPSFQSGVPHVLFEGAFLPAVQHATYDVNANAQRFIMILDRTVDTRPTQIAITLNWLDKSRRAADSR
jgi:eukaryotic-like serine/threonine-protein kinase